LAGTKARDIKISLTEVFYIHPTGTLQTHRIGNWSSSNGSTWSTVPFSDRRGDLQEAVIQSGVKTAVSLVVLTNVH